MCLALPWGVQRYHHPPDPGTMAMHPLSLSDRTVQVDTQIYSEFIWEQKAYDLLTDL